MRPSAALHRLHEGAEGFEDGTPDFLGIAALPAGFALLEKVSMPRLRERVAALTSELFARLRQLQHSNGAPRIRLYGPDSLSSRGGTLCFNVLDVHGSCLPYAQVEIAAREAGISVRGGCFCNPGASEAAFGVDPVRLARCLEEVSDDFHARRLSDCLDTEVGAVRASLGLANNSADLDRLVALLTSAE